MCEEYKSCHVRMGRPVLVGQSDPLFVPTSVKKTPTPSTNDPAQEDLLQKYQERVDKLSQQNRVIKFCTDAGFLTTVDVGQYFMTKDTEQFSQFTESVACREYTLPRDVKSSDPKGWIRGNTRIGPVLEVTTSYLQGKYGVEIRIDSVNKDNSHSWVRISNGLNKLVTDLSNKEYDDNDQETSETKSEEFPLKTNELAFASRPKAKAKPRRPTSACSSIKTLPIGERKWTDLEPEDYSPVAYPVSKQLSTLFVMVRNLEKMMERLSSGEETNLSTLNIGLMICGRARWQKAEETRKDFNIVVIHQDKKFFISDHFKVIQDVALLILHYRTMS